MATAATYTIELPPRLVRKVERIAAKAKRDMERAVRDYWKRHPPKPRGRSK